MGTNNAETFLDKIECKSKIKDVNKFGIDDIKNLKSLLDVSTLKWLKYCSKGEEEMKKGYKTLYKGVCKDLDSLKKNCLAIKKCEPDKLKEDVGKCMELKEKIEKTAQEALTKAHPDENVIINEKIKIPVNMKLIAELNKLTVEFNKLRAKDDIKPIYEAVELKPKPLETYKEFESRMQAKWKTNVPLVMVGEFVKEKKDLLEEEDKAMSNYFDKLRKEFISGDVKKSYDKTIEELAKSVGLSKSDLNGCFELEYGFKKIGKGLYDKLAGDLLKKVKEISSEEFKLNKDEENVKSDEEIKEEIKKIMVDKEKEVENEVKKKVNNNDTGILGWFFGSDKTSDKFGMKTSLYDCFSYNFEDRYLNESVRGVIKNFSEAWINFESSYINFVNALNIMYEGRKKVDELRSEFWNYYVNISNITDKIEKNNKIGKDNKKAKVTLELPKNFNKSVEDFNLLANKIGKTVSKIKVCYDDAIKDAERARGSIEIFVGNNDDKFKKCLDGKTVNNWEPKKGDCWFSLGEALLLTNYCIRKYEDKNFGFDEGLENGFNEFLNSCLEKNERIKLGITQKELRKIIDNS